jgi:hypothetical protein
LELAERVEASAVADRELDGAIHEALGFCLHTMVLKRFEVEPGEGDLLRVCSKCDDRKGAAPLMYTRSIDAASRLVESGKWAITAQGDRGGWEAWAWTGDQAPNWHVGASPALALTAAALRSLTTPDSNAGMSS